jgi:hypothetical protein
MELSHFVQPLGITTLVSLLTTVILGLFRRKKPLLFIPWHRIQAFITLGLAVTHFLLVFFSE